ncbi:MAG: hypothetical protein IME93_05125 [Proteobacteria bacterium]|nr:hypothetical protein [Pseudomonadota bacterium]
MKSITKRSIQGIGITILSIMMLSGCVSLSAVKTDNLASNAKILIMPARDVVQNGLAHASGKGSGRQLQESVQRRLSAISGYTVIVFEANEQFNHTETIKREDAVAEAKKQGADYCLLLTLGEFRNAAPMTFRSDFATLDGGVLIDVNTNQEVWSVKRPYFLEKGNIGNHRVLIETFANDVARSIAR